MPVSESPLRLKRSPKPSAWRASGMGTLSLTSRNETYGRFCIDVSSFQATWWKEQSVSRYTKRGSGVANSACGSKSNYCDMKSTIPATGFAETKRLSLPAVTLCDRIPIQSIREQNRPGVAVSKKQKKPVKIQLPKDA